MPRERFRWWPVIAGISLALVTTTLAGLAASKWRKSGCGVRNRFDVVIRGGLVVDGTGAPPYRGEVAVCGTRIARIVNMSQKLRALREIDATGFVVAPGFIDMLGQSDYAIF